MKKHRENEKILSGFAAVSLALTAISLLLLDISRASVSAADFINSTVSFGYRRAMAALSDLFPFSLFELLIFLLPLIVAVVVILAIRAFKRGKGRARFVINFISIILLFYAANVIALSVSYNTTTVDKKMGFEITKVNAENLAETMIALRDEVNSLAPKISFNDEGISDPGYTMDEISSKICDSYSKVSREYGFVPDFHSRAKGVGPFSVVMSYLNITGIYTYFTGEANVNTCYPTYDMVFTTAHELSHQRGVLRENEANFMAYIVCSSSDDVYLRYSAALNMYQYIASALYRTDKDLYYSIVSGLDERANRDILKSNEVYRKYGDTFIADISEFFNDLFLKSNGTDGVVTYGRVVTLAVSYFSSQK